MKRTKYTPNLIIVSKDYAEIALYNNKCERVATTKIDSEDVPIVRKYKWYLDKDGYAFNSKNSLQLHRLLMNPPKNKIIDHIDRNSLNNRKNNLRITTQKVNRMNTCAKGITWDKFRNKWTAQLRLDGKNYQKRFNTKEKAIEYRKLLEIKYFTPFLK